MNNELNHELYEQIIRRKSFRSFRPEPPMKSVMEGLVDFISDLTPPEPEIEWNFDTLPYLDMVRICASEPGVRAPYYLVLRAERKRFSLQNCGYLGEMAVLYLTAHDVATCWQGSAKISSETDFPNVLPFVSAVAFGMSNEAFRSGAAEFDRKPYEKFVFNREEAYRPILEMARLAPSSYNCQTCVCVTDDRHRIHLFRKSPYFRNPVKEFEQCVDAGAVLAHLELAAREAGYSPKIERLKPEPTFRRTLAYQATVTLE